MREISESIVLRRKNKVSVNHVSNVQPLELCASNKDVYKELVRMVLAGAKNIEPYGYVLDTSVASALLKTDSEEYIISFFRWLECELKTLTAADVKYKPMYPNFPYSVVAASDIELYFNAILHYISGGVCYPDESFYSYSRMPLIYDDTKKLITLAKGNEAEEILANLLGSKTSLSEQDKEDMRNLLSDIGDDVALPDEIPLKENVALIGKLMIGLNIKNGTNKMKKYFKTATDVLRFVVSLSNGDISLAEKTKFSHLNRPQRRMVMGLLENCDNILEDMFRYRDEWIRIGEILHAGEYKMRYPKVVESFQRLRNEPKPLFLMGHVETEIANGNVIKAVEYLVKRPGEFARRLDKILRDCKTTKDLSDVVSSFMSVADKVSTPVLLQVRQAFKNRVDKKEYRVFFPKGSVAKAVSIENNLPDIPEVICNMVVNVCENALRNVYGLRGTMGKVYISDELKKFNVPFSQRNASSGNKILTRGSRVKVGHGKSIIRGFIWWTNTGNNKDKDPWSGSCERVDLDLSSCILDENLNYLGHVSYTNLRSGIFNGYHSGDITNGGPANGNGVAEFLDVNIDSVVSNGGRYICYQVYSFTGQPFSKLPNCRFGFMERDSLNSGEIFEPSTVELAIKLSSDTRVSVPVLFDCVEREFIWMDLASGNNSLMANNIENNKGGVKSACWAILNINKANMYDLIALNANARGFIVSDRNDADIIFDNDTTKPKKLITERVVDDEGEHYYPKHVENDDVQIITGYDVDYFMGKLL